MNKRGQIALFVIIAIVLVVVILFAFTIGKKGVEVDISPDKNPKAFVEKCLKDATEEAIEILLPQGGFIEPRDFKLYNDINVGYLCKNRGNYKPCINHHPMFLNDIKEEIGKYVRPRIEQCLVTLKNELEKRQYIVGLSDFNISADLSPGTVRPILSGRITIVKGEESRGFTNIDAKVDSPLYDLARVAMDIVNSESMFCYFEYVGYMSLYPRFQIKKTTVSDSTRIYTIIDRNRETNNEMNIAIRGCVIPQGI